MKNDELFDFKTYLTLMKMLNSTEEDFNLAIEIIKNLNLNPIYYSIMVKNLKINKKNSFYNFFNFNPTPFVEIKEQIYANYIDDKLLIKIYNNEAKLFFNTVKFKTFDKFLI